MKRTCTYPLKDGQACRNSCTIPDVCPYYKREITEEELWKPAMEVFHKRVEKFYEDSPQFGPTKAQLYGAWHESVDVILNLLKEE